jgi:hypothetical protein
MPNNAIPLPAPANQRMILDPSDQYEIADGTIGEELMYVVMVTTQDLLNHHRRAVPSAYPDDLWRHACDDAALVEIRVLGNDDESVLFRVVLYDLIRSAIQAGRLNVHRSRIGIQQQINESGGKILVETHPHAFDTSWWRSRSAA